MGLTLAEFHALVSDALGRGSTLDSVIPTRVQMSARWLERNYTFQYMRQLREINVDSSAEFPYIVSLYDLEVKKIESLRRRTTGTDGSISFGRPLSKVRPEDRSTRPLGEPESYWLNGVSSIILNSVPDEDMVFEGNFVLFTKWGTASNWTHWLIDQATQLLLCRSLMALMPRTRDPALYSAHKAEFDLELQSFNVAEEDLQVSDPVIARWEPPESSINHRLRENS